MAAGTITIYNNSTAVTGAGTAFASTLAPGDFIVFTAGGVVYTCAVDSVSNDVSATLTKAYTGPTVGGAAWEVVKRNTASLITMELANQVTEAMRGLLLDKTNWQQVLSNSGNVTVTLSDGSTFSGPSWAYLVTLLKNKPDMVNGVVPVSAGGTGSGNATEALTNLQGLSINGASDLKSRYRFTKGAYGVTFDDVPATGYGAVFAGWNNAPMAYNHNVVTDGTFFADSVHRYVYSGVAAGAFYTGLTASTTEIAYAIGHVRDAGTLSAHFVFNTNGSAYASSGNWVNSSDERIKKDITRIETPLAKMRAIKGCTWLRKDNNNFGIGFIAQDVQKAFPDAVTTNGMSLTMADGKIVKDVLFPDTSGVAAGLHHEAILTLMDNDEEKEARLNNMEAFLKTLGYDPANDYTRQSAEG